jgi:hypothetical protein
MTDVAHPPKPAAPAAEPAAETTGADTAEAGVVDGQHGDAAAAVPAPSGGSTKE